MEQNTLMLAAMIAGYSSIPQVRTFGARLPLFQCVARVLRALPPVCKLRSGKLLRQR